MIGLSRKRLEGAEPAETESAKAAATSRRPPQELRGGVGSSTGPLIKMAVEQPQQPDSQDNQQQQ